MVIGPSDWRAAVPGMGSCFHQALHRWALLRQQGDIYKIAIGVVAANDLDPHRHLHAWLQRDDIVISAVSGDMQYREAFYHFVGVERGSVSFVNPRKIMRDRRGAIDRGTIVALLNAAGIPWRVVNGGVLPK